MDQFPSPTAFDQGNENFGYEHDSKTELHSSVTSNGKVDNISKISDTTVTMGDSDGEASIEFNTIEDGRKSSDKPARNAIRVEGANKRFGKEVVLNGLYMTVQEGTIYGLLGSSGCGKTTILSAIVGLRKLDDGRISIFGKMPGTRDCGVPGRLVGYMPQEIALNGEFTMEEVCQYFGRIYGMDMMKVQERVDTLVELLDLTRCRGHLNTFSGGQKRRASFLVALLHEPQLLILDEPTVGVDPVLRAKIWDHIRHLTDTCGTTIILTTHYIEEMRQADRVGIMRGGKLMAEASPSNLLASHKATMLEEVVLKYCLRTKDTDERELTESKPRKNTISFDQLYETPRNSKTSESFYAKNRLGFGLASYASQENHSTSTVNRLWALTRKNVTVILRNVGFLLFLLGVPAIIVLFFALSVGKTPTSLEIGFINNESSDFSFCDEATPFTCNADHLSCAYLDILRSFNILSLSQYRSIDEALAAVDSQKSWGYVHFSPNFSRHVFDRTLGRELTNETIHGSKIRVRLDMMTVSTGQIMKKLIFDAYRVFAQKLLIACQVDLTGRDLPVEFGEPIYGREDWTYTTFLVPGIVIGFLPFLSLVSCALSYIIEKKDGMLDRSKVAGVTAFEIMLSHSIPQFGIIFAQAVVAFVIMYFVDIPYNLGSPALAFLLVIAAAITGMTIGFAAAEIFDEEKNAMLFAMAVMFPSFILSGLLWPLEGVPTVLRTIGILTPATFPAKAIRAILFRGWDISYFTVYMGFVSQVIMSLVFMAITFIVHRIRK